MSDPIATLLDNNRAWLSVCAKKTPTTLSAFRTSRTPIIYGLAAPTAEYRRIKLLHSRLGKFSYTATSPTCYTTPI